jgi:hypothetical protein
LLNVQQVSSKIWGKLANIWENQHF